MTPTPRGRVGRICLRGLFCAIPCGGVWRPDASGQRMRLSTKQFRAEFVV
jgi:hypothetical protein